MPLGQVLLEQFEFTEDGEVILNPIALVGAEVPK